jgi:hypothetical protein
MELHQILSGSIALTADSKTYQLGPLRLAVIAELQRRFRAKLGNPIAAAHELAKGLSDDMARYVLDKAFDAAMIGERVDPVAFDKWLDSTEGHKLACILRLIQNHPELTEEQAESVIAADLSNRVAGRLAELHRGNEESRSNGPGTGGDSPNGSTTPAAPTSAA